MRDVWMNWLKNCHKELIKHPKYWKKPWKVYQTSNFNVKNIKLLSHFLIDFFFFTFFRWRNYIIRGIFTFIMIMGFCLIIYGGPLALMITVIYTYHASVPIVFLIKYIFLFTDIASASEMFRRDYFDWISSVSHSWLAMVS